MEHSPGNPTFEFMSAAGDEYLARGGKLTQHIGGPAKAIMSLVHEKIDAKGSRTPGRANLEQISNEAFKRGQTYVRTVSVYVDHADSPEHADEIIEYLNSKTPLVQIRLPDDDSDYQWEEC